MKDEFSLEAKLYDKVWGKHDYDADVRFLVEVFKAHGCKSIVDLGCGTGNHALRLSDIGYKVTGVDVSPAMLKTARKKDRNGKVRFVKGDMKDIEAVLSGLKRFDAAISLGQVFHHLYTDQQVRDFLGELSTVLRRNGLFVFNVNNAVKINDERLNRLVLEHLLIEDKVQLAVLAQNRRDIDDPNTIVWTPLYFMRIGDRVDFQAREHRLHWFRFKSLKNLLVKAGFEIEAVYSGPSKESFDEHVHPEMWFVATCKK
jgi:SAM-dependent methyltransferase